MRFLSARSKDDIAYKRDGGGSNDVVPAVFCLIAMVGLRPDKSPTNEVRPNCKALGLDRCVTQGLDKLKRQ